MSDVIDIGAPPPPAPLTQNEAHSMAEHLAAAGVPPEQIRAHLKERGADPDRAITPADEAQWRLTQLKADPAFGAKVNAGDMEANDLLNKLTAQISLGQKYTPVAETAKPDDYANKFDLRRVQGSELQQRVQDESAQWAADLKLPTNVASAVIDSVLDYTQTTALLTPDEKLTRGEHELGQLRDVLAKSGDPDAQLAEARKTIKLYTGRDIDLAGVARTSGVQVAHELFLHAQALAFKAGRR